MSESCACHMADIGHDCWCSKARHTELDHPEGERPCAGWADITVPLGTLVIVTSEASLKKYGLDEQGWLRILRDQGWVCLICRKPSSTGRYVVDHYHAPRFKDLTDEDKRSLIRGITCWFCNHAYLGRGITVEKARNVLAYLEEFEARKPDPLPKPPPKVRKARAKPKK